MPPRRPVIIGHHLILHGYGHWLPNDPRGSGSETLRNPSLDDLGKIHFGRKRVQPPREDVREFYRGAALRLRYLRLWFDGAKRQAIGDAIGEIVASRRYTLWACAVMKNHLHLCVRRHRDDAVEIWRAIANETRAALQACCNVSDDHPVWSDRPYKVFLTTQTDVLRVVRYIEQNPEKSGVPPQAWPFVKFYDGWPHAHRVQ